MKLKNLPRCLESSSRITKDIKFVFNDCFWGETEKLSFSAHRVILSVASDVFETQFYGGLQEPRNEILITDASYKAFKFMIEFIYNRKHAWEVEDISFMSEMYYLGEKYHLDDLKTELLDSLSKYQINHIRRENFLDVAKLAEKQAHHPDLSKSLYNIVAMFLQNKFKGDIGEVLKLFSEVETDTADATNSFILHKLMSTLNDIRKQHTCSNNNFPCLCNSEPTKNNFLVGARIRIVKGKHFHSGIDPYATLERFSKSKADVFIAKKATGYISCYFGRGSYVYVCGEN